MLSVHNTPFGDIVDTEDDLQPLVHQTFRDAVRAVSLVAASLQDRDLRRRRDGAPRAARGSSRVTELADTLTREHGLPFVQSHAIAAGLVEAHRAAPERPLRRAARRGVGAGGRPAIGYDAARLRDILCPRHFVRVRETRAAGAGETGAAVREGVDAARADQDWLPRRASAWPAPIATRQPALEAL